jgi:two-component system, NarL family, invasion response regulator UvrY
MRPLPFDGAAAPYRSTRMARVLIADDHAVVRAGLRQFLEEDRGIVEIGEASTGREALDALRRGGWDLLILDINMPDRSGLDILSHIRAAGHNTRVLVMSGLPERQYALNVLRAGARGYLSKDGAPEELLKAVRTILEGRRYVSPALAELLVSELDQDADKPLHSRLSEREFQVLCKLAAGRAVSDIAGELCLSVKTVSTYRTRVLEKMHLETNADLTTYALRNGLIQ